MAMYLGSSQVAFNNVYEVIPAGHDEAIEDKFLLKTLSGVYSNSRLTAIGPYAFYGFSQVTSFNFPNVTSIGISAFDGCTKLTTINLGNVTSMGSYAFRSCYSLTSISLPNMTTIPSYAFNYCSALRSIYCPNVVSIYYEAFWSCINLSSVSFPAATLISGYAFEYCSALRSAYFPNVTQIRASAFYYCINLSQISLPKISLFSGTNIFASCYNLISLNLTGVSSVPTLSSSTIFNSTPIGGYSTSAGRYGSIYVPASLYTAFTTATNWSLFSARMVSV